MSEEKYPILEGYEATYIMRRKMHAMIYAGVQPMVKSVEDFLNEVVRESDFSICVHANDLQQIIETDSVKSMFETGQGTSIGGHDARKEQVKRLYGVDPEKLDNADFPKFGLLTQKGKKTDLAIDPDIFYRYGAIMINLRKENFMNRTTMTVGSSFDFNESVLKSPTFVNDPKALCIKGFPTTLNNMGARWFNGLAFFNDMIESGKISAKHPNSLAMAADDMIGFENFELQLHGPIVVSRDVESVSYFPLIGDEEEVIAKVAPKLDDLGIKHECIMI